MVRRWRISIFPLGQGVLPVAEQEGVKIACDIQDLVEVNNPYRVDFIKAADFLFFSAANHVHPTPLIQRFLELNPELVIVSGLGSRGCMLGSHTTLTHFPAVKLDLPVVDTNRAGDALALGFLTSYVFEKRSLEQSVLRRTDLRKIQMRAEIDVR